MLRIRSCYSIKKSLITLNSYLDFIETNNFDSAILVDVNTSAFVIFNKMCKSRNIKPVFGFEKENEYIIFPTNEQSLKVFFNVVNGDESNFDGLIVYNINSEVNFSSAQHVVKKFDHNVYNCLFGTNYGSKIFGPEFKLNVLNPSDYYVDELLTRTNYNLDFSDKMFSFNNSYEVLVKMIKVKLEKANKVLSEVERNRLNYELKIIKEMNFCSYFLIYAQIINYLNENKILYGFGRGSAASSYVCYLLNITKINPLEHNLLFERFLNKSRKDYPDIDLDVDSLRRDEVVEKLLSKYTNSAKISTFTKLGQNRAQQLVNEKYKLPPLILKKLLDKDEVDNIVKTDSSVQNFINEVNLIKDVIIGSSVHPAGIIISSKNLCDYVEVKNKVCTTDYYSLEALGFVKFDLLNLNTLSNILKVNKLIKSSNVKRVNFDLNDEKIFKMLNNLETRYIFQLDSRLARDVLKSFNLNSFNDIAILISLNRPGTKDLLEEIVANQKQKRNGNGTYNVLIFQEQIIELLVKNYKLNPSQADEIRVAISKKDESKLNKLKAYINSRNYDIKYFNYALKYTSFAFNKAHAYSYAKLVMQVAYYKCYYPVEFMLAFTSDNLALEDILYLKYLKQNIVGFSKQSSSLISPNGLRLGLKYLKIDQNIKKFIEENKCEELYEVRNNFENKISDNDIKNIIASALFENHIQTSDKFEIEQNSISSLLRMRNWQKVENKIKHTFTKTEFDMFQIETLGFGFSKVFENDKIIKVENIQKFKSIYRGTCISNFGRVDFITFKNLNMEVGKNYFVNMKTDFFDGNIKLVIFDAREI